MKEKSIRFCELQDNVNWIDIYVTVILRAEKKKMELYNSYDFYKLFKIIDSQAQNAE